MPSATGSRPSSRRSVRFEADDGDIFGTDSRPSSTSKRHQASHIEDMINQDGDWLDMVAGGTDKSDKPGNQRPRSAPEATNKSDTSDWLGLSNVGQSKSQTMKAATKDDPDDFLFGSKKITTEKKKEDPDDWLKSLGNEVAPKKATKEPDEPDDWLSFKKPEAKAKEKEKVLESDEDDFIFRKKPSDKKEESIAKPVEKPKQIEKPQTVEVPEIVSDEQAKEQTSTGWLNKDKEDSLDDLSAKKSQPVRGRRSFQSQKITEEKLQAFDEPSK